MQDMLCYEYSQGVRTATDFRLRQTLGLLANKICLWMEANVRIHGETLVILDLLHHIRL